MGKIINITDKLSLESTYIQIGDVKVKVNDDAKTVLQLLEVVGKEEVNSLDRFNTAYELLFSLENREKIDSLGLNFKDCMILIQEAMSLITENGADARQGK